MVDNFFSQRNIVRRRDFLHFRVTDFEWKYSINSKRMNEYIRMKVLNVVFNE
jgi:hypothetical protein